MRPIEETELACPENESSLETTLLKEQPQTESPTTNEPILAEQFVSCIDESTINEEEESAVEEQTQDSNEVEDQIEEDLSTLPHKQGKITPSSITFRRIPILYAHISYL